MKNKQRSTITTNDVKHVSQLAKLSLTKAEVNKFRQQLSNIFGYVNQIGEMNTEAISETSQVAGIINQFRQDKVDKKSILSQKASLSQAKKTYQGYFVVKSIFEGDDETS